MAYVNNICYSCNIVGTVDLHKYWQFVPFPQTVGKCGTSKKKIWPTLDLTFRPVATLPRFIYIGSLSDKHNLSLPVGWLVRACQTHDQPRGYDSELHAQCTTAGTVVKYKGRENTAYIPDARIFLITDAVIRSAVALPQSHPSPDK